MNQDLQLLHTTFNFTPEDLAANRLGQITDRQRESIKRIASRGRIYTLFGVGIVLAIMAVAFFFAPNFKELRDQMSKDPRTMQIVLIGVGGSLLLYFLLIIYSLIRQGSAASGKVQPLRGKFKKVGQPGGIGQDIYQMIFVGRRRLMIPVEQANLLIPGQEYTFYLAGSGMGAKVLSIEPPGSSALASMGGYTGGASGGAVSPIRRFLGLLQILLGIAFAVGLVVGWELLGEYGTTLSFMGWNLAVVGGRVLVGVLVLFLTINGTRNLLAR